MPGAIPLPVEEGNKCHVIELPFTVVVGRNMSLPRRDCVVLAHRLRVGTRDGLGCDHGHTQTGEVAVSFSSALHGELEIEWWK